MTQQTASPNRGWTVVFAALAINLIIGALYAWGVIKKALVNLNMIAVSSQPSLWDIPGNINKAPEVDAITDELVQA